MKTLAHLGDGQIGEFVLIAETEIEIGKIVDIIRRRARRTAELSAVSIESEQRIRVLNGGVDGEIFVTGFQTVSAEIKTRSSGANRGRSDFETADWSPVVRVGKVR